MKRLNFILLFLFNAAILTSCEEAYKPKVSASDVNLLVVDGGIVAGQDSTIINISRTILVSEKKIANPEVGAIVNVEGENNETFLLQEKSKGVYVSSGLNLDPAKKYRLSIKTAKNVLYKSDFVEVKVSPPIDDVVWKVDGNRVNIFTSTHDATNKSQYYKWNYAETWIFYADLESEYRWNGTEVVPRSFVNDGIFQCWGNEKSSNIVIGSSAKLDNDVIFEAPVTFVQSGSEKFRERYSILVKQQALTKEAYEFWDALKKNTESLGSIFDVQPTQLTGNIHNVNDPNEPILGFISVSTVSQKRIYIDRASLPSTFIIPRSAKCADQPVEIKTEDMKVYYGSFLTIPIGRNTGASRYCADCTIRGTRIKPSFWQ